MNSIAATYEAKLDSTTAEIFNKLTKTLGGEGGLTDVLDTLNTTLGGESAKTAYYEEIGTTLKT
jgi:hypothetical protein